MYLLLVEVDEKVLLALKLPRQLLSRDRAERSLFGLDLRVRIHPKLVRNIYKTRRRQKHVIAICPQLRMIVPEIVSLNAHFGQKKKDGVVC